MLKIFCGQPLPDLPPVEILRPFWGGRNDSRRIGGDPFNQLISPVFELTTDPTAADYFLLPHNYNYLYSRRDYLEHWCQLSNQSKKHLIVVWPGDSTKAANLNCRNIVFRNSQYRRKQRRGEIIMPAYVEDLSSVEPPAVRFKSDQATVGFCGWASASSFWRTLKTELKARLTYPPTQRQGLWWRRRAIKILTQSALLKTDFLIRRSYSGHRETISLDPVLARREFVANIVNNDFTLCVRGDGNFSTRFFEVLSLGRIPILIDTDCPLPLENIVDYDSLILRVSYRDLFQIDKIISQFYSEINQEEFTERQLKARKVFNQYLRIDAFFRFLFSRDRLKEYAKNLA